MPSFGHTSLLLDRILRSSILPSLRLVRPNDSCVRHPFEAIRSREQESYDLISAIIHGVAERYRSVVRCPHLILGELATGPLFGTVQFPSGASPVEGPHVGLAPSQHQSVPSTGMSRWAMRNVAPALWYPSVVDRSVTMRKAVRGAFAGK